MPRHYYLLAIGAGVLLWAAVTPSEPPNTLTEARKQLLVQRLHTEVLYGQLLYDMPQVFPPAVHFDLQGGDVAQAVCAHEDLERGVATWSLRVDEQLAARNWDRFLVEALPHEAAHLILCQARQSWTEHDDRWRSVVRELGAEPKEYHDYD